MPVKIENPGPDITEFVAAPSPFTPDGLDDDITNDIANITFKLSDYGFSTVKVFDKNMNLVKTLCNGVLYPDPAKEMKIQLQWNGRNDSNQLVRNGEYKVVVSTGSVKTASAFIIVNDRPIFNNFKVVPPTFSPDGDGINDAVTLSFSLSEDSAWTTEVYNFQNLLVKAIAKNVPAVAGQIYNYTWDGKNESGQVTPQGRYYFKVSATALTGSQANPLKMNIFVLYISNIKATKDTFNPYLAETTQISYRLVNNVKLSIKIYDPQNIIVRNLITNQPRSSGEYNEAWDGKDNAGNIVRDNYYYFTIEDSISGATEVIYNPLGTGGQDISHSIALSSTAFDTLKNQPGIITYSLPRPAKVNIKVRAERYSGPAVRVIKYQEPTGSGQYQAVWDGRDELGNTVGAYQGYTLGVWGYTIEENAIVVTGGRPVVSAVTTNPVKFNPVLNPYAAAAGNTTAVSFSLSKDAFVTIDIYNANNVLVRKLLNNVLKSTGANVVAWDGKNDKAEVLPNGFYRVDIQAEKDGNFSDIATAHSEVIY